MCQAQMIKSRGVIELSYPELQSSFLNRKTQECSAPNYSAESTQE